MEDSIEPLTHHTDTPYIIYRVVIQPPPSFQISSLQTRENYNAPKMRMMITRLRPRRREPSKNQYWTCYRTQRGSWQYAERDSHPL